MKRDYFSRKKRQFMNLSNRVNELIFTGEWGKLSSDTRNKIILKLNALYKQLRMYLSQWELKKILAAAAIFIGFPLVSMAQSFAPPQLNPFGLEPDSVNIATPVFADIDNDGDFDLFSGNYSDYGASIEFYENTGTATTPHFAPPLQNPFGITLTATTVGFPAFADIDHDGDLDLFLGIMNEQVYEANFQFFENTGTESAPSFAPPLTNPFGLSPAYMFAIPEFADIDNDGDLDLFAGEGYGNMKFFENTGTATAPNFATPLQNPFGITPAYIFGSPAFADIDHDGDLDLFIGEYYGNMLYFQNTGTANLPAFAPLQENPFGLVPTNYYNFPAFADLDDDGDVDLLVGEYYGNFQYFQNTEFGTGITENPGEAIFDLYPNPAMDGVYISLKDNSQNKPYAFYIYDQPGRIVETGYVNSRTMKLETGNLVPGFYFVSLVQEEKIFTRKLIIQ